MALSFTQWNLQAGDPSRRQGVVQLITNESVFLRRLNFVSVQGFYYEYNLQTSLGGIAWRGLNETYTDDTGVVNPRVESLRPFGGTVKTDRQLAKGLRGTATRANNIAAKVKRAGLYFDNAVINGDSAVNPKSIDGLRARLTGTQVIAAGGAITQDLLDQALDAVVGSNSQKIIVCNKFVRRKLSKVVREAAKGATLTDIQGQLTMYSDAPIEVLDEDGDTTEILPFTETGSTCSLYVIRPGSAIDGEYVQGLVRILDGQPPIEQVEYGERSGVVEDLVEAVMGLGVFHPRSAARISGITKT